ncbi:hypothetical protein PYJP_17340 [Pyrofollis japonicus]|uniref:NADH-quinone oxidoreductase subunit C n=1 Tax=Pyrofollis japonicus TaxID=3060460 RepID=UPI00295BCF71|nr:NADH-quinone oxidoreductase subunit C [Pyrofollis japonicus]BEP18382.1 hypothetical protein PYJP_17340 [Pyrofollis japonicus]
MSETPRILEQAIVERGYDASGIPMLRVHPDYYHKVIEILSENGYMFVSLSAIHWRGLFEVIVLLYSLEQGALMISVIFPEDEELDSIVDLYPGAYLYEAEAYEMFGIVFRGNPRLRRHFTPEELGHPLRKEYELQETPIGGWGR